MNNGPGAAICFGDRSLAALRDLGKAALADFKLLCIDSAAQLATLEADTLYARLCELAGSRQDPCVRDVLSAAIHEARTGENLQWRAFAGARKGRQAAGAFPDAGVRNSAVRGSTFSMQNDRPINH